MQNFDILCGGKWDPRESENRTYYFSWELEPFNGRKKHFPEMFDKACAGLSLVTTLRHFLLLLPKRVYISGGRHNETRGRHNKRPVVVVASWRLFWFLFLIQLKKFRGKFWIVP